MKSKRYAQQSLGYLLNKDAPWWSGQDQLWVSLRSRDPGATGTQTSSELKYGGYSRIAVKREGWTVNAEGVDGKSCADCVPGTAGRRRTD